MELQTKKITITTIFVLTNKETSCHIHTTSIILHQSDTKWCAKHAENHPPFARHIKIKDNSEHQEQI